MKGGGVNFSTYGCHKRRPLGMSGRFETRVISLKGPQVYRRNEVSSLGIKRRDGSDDDIPRQNSDLCDALIQDETSVHRRCRGTGTPRRLI